MSRPDHGRHAIKELRDRTNWPLDTLRHELAYQQRPALAGIAVTLEPGRCGHDARGSGFCAGCLQAEIERREARND